MPPEEKKIEPKKELGVGEVKSLRTYEGDVAEALGKNQVTVAQIAIAENAKQEETPVQVIANRPEPPKRTGGKALLALFSLLLIAGGVLGALFFFQKSAYGGYVLV